MGRVRVMSHVVLRNLRALIFDTEILSSSANLWHWGVALEMIARDFYLGFRKWSATEVKRKLQKDKKKRMPTTHGVPKRSPIKVLTGLERI